MVKKFDSSVYINCCVGSYIYIFFKINIQWVKMHMKNSFFTLMRFLHQSNK